jgi:hypothetical protein
MTTMTCSKPLFVGFQFRPLPFPFYFEELYRFVHQYEQYDQQLLVSVTSSQQKKIHEKRFQLILTQIPPLLLSLHTQHGHELLMPYILDAFRHPIYGVRCVYSLFNPVAVVLGPDESRKQLLTLIQSVLNPEKTTIHHWRCFTRRFIIQLIARFSLNKFLNSFPILLIEACSGFKDEIVTKTDSNDDTSSTSDSNTDADETSVEGSDTATAPEQDLNMFEV